MFDSPASSHADPMAEILEKLSEEIAERPPTIGVVGVSGVGKSSTINAMFRTDLPTSHTVACTTEFRATDLSVMVQTPASQTSKRDVARDEREQPRVRLRVVDAPGLGEDVATDGSHLDEYRRNLPDCDAILWVMTARNRAVALDQIYLRQLADFHPRMVFGVNQVDLVEPGDWRADFNIPSQAQENNIRAIHTDRSARLRTVLGFEPTVVAYSSRYGYRLERLYATLLRACPPHRQWIYALLKNFNYLDFIPDETQQRLSFKVVQALSRLRGGPRGGPVI